MMLYLSKKIRKLIKVSKLLMIIILLDTHVSDHAQNNTHKINETEKELF